LLLLVITYYYIFNFKDNLDASVDEPANNLEEPVVNEEVYTINAGNLFGKYLYYDVGS